MSSESTLFVDHSSSDIRQDTHGVLMIGRINLADEANHHFRCAAAPH